MRGRSPDLRVIRAKNVTWVTQLSSCWGSAQRTVEVATVTKRHSKEVFSNPVCSSSARLTLHRDGTRRLRVGRPGPWAGGKFWTSADSPAKSKWAVWICPFLSNVFHLQKGAIYHDLITHAHLVVPNHLITSFAANGLPSISAKVDSPELTPHHDT